MLKVVWFVNVALPEASQALGIPCFYKAGWLEAYIEALKACGGIKLTVVCRTPLVRTKLETALDGVNYVMFPSLRNENMRAPVPQAIDDYRRIVEEHKPDLIHYHGSEFHYGLLTAKRIIETPAVLSIQGLMSEIAKACLGGLSLPELLKSHTMRELYHRGGIWGAWRSFERRAVIESEILQGMPHIIGRTLWDKAHVSKISPKSRYHHCDELLRPVFYESRRPSGNYRRFSIYASTASYPLKGFHFLLKAVALVKHQFPMVRVRIADVQLFAANSTNGYLRYLHSLVRELGLEDQLEWLGPLTGTGVADILSDSHVFVAASVTENSCNALAEAMVVGVPSIATYTGGMATMISDMRTGLHFPIGDYAMLAENIIRIFRSDVLGEDLSSNARDVALKRHDYLTVSKRLLEIYKIVATKSS